LDINHLGHYQSSSNSQIVQYLPDAIGNGGVEHSGQNDVLKQFQFRNGKLSSSPVAVSSITFVNFGVQPSVSANGDKDGIVWASEDIYNSSGAQVNGVLHAFDANNVAQELYNSAQNATRDSYGKEIRFTLPTVAHGRVYVVGNAELAIFGLLSQ